MNWVRIYSRFRVTVPTDVRIHTESGRRSVMLACSWPKPDGTTGVARVEVDPFISERELRWLAEKVEDAITSAREGRRPQRTGPYRQPEDNLWSVADAVRSGVLGVRVVDNVTPALRRAEASFHRIGASSERAGASISAFVDAYTRPFPIPDPLMTRRPPHTWRAFWPWLRDVLRWGTAASKGEPLMGKLVTDFKVNDGYRGYDHQLAMYQELIRREYGREARVVKITGLSS